MSKNYNVLIIGAGSIASDYDQKEDVHILTHAHAVLKSSNLSLLGFYDINYENARKAADKWGVNAYRSLDDINETVDAVCCAVPDSCHYNVLCECIDLAGVKVVIGEKPITQRSIQAQRVITIYAAKDIQLIINYTRRYMDSFMRLKERIRFMGEFRVGYCEYGKGLIHNCSHMINLLEYLMGELELYSVGEKTYDYYPEDPSVEFILKSGQKKIYFNPIPCHEVTVFEFELFFEKGRVRYVDSDFIIEYFNLGESTVYEKEINYKLCKKEEIDISQALMGLYRNVYDVLEGKAFPLCSGNEAYRTLLLCEEILEKVEG